MGAFDKIKDRAKSLIGNSGDKIAAGVDKATDAIDKKTGGKYHDKLEKLDGLADKLDKTGKGGEAAAGEATAGEAVPTEAEVEEEGPGQS